MSLYASKLFAINIVEVADGRFAASDSSAKSDDSDSRLRLLENQVESLKEWKTSFLLNTTALMRDSSPSSLASISTAHEEEPHVSDTSASPIWSPKMKPVPKERLITKSETLKPLDVNGSEPDVTSRIMTIIQGYGQNEENTSDDAWLGRFKFEPMVRKAVDKNAPILLVLPAFPWKSQ